MNFPLVSVVMPVYNGEKYLKEAIDSILSQSYRNIELVMVNDGSTDSSKAIIQSYADSRVRLVENEINSGIVFTRNKGLESASGAYIATLDCDDIALPDRIEKQVDFLEKNPDYGMCGSFYIIIDEKGKKQKKMRLPTNNRDISTFLMVGNCFCNSAVMIRGELVKELRYRENFDIVEDYDLWYRISKRAKIANLNFYGTYYRVHGNNISVSKMNEMFARVRKINVQILTDLHIDFSDRELDIYANWLNGNFLFFNKGESFSELAAWIYKFYRKVSGNSVYNNKLLLELISEKWLFILFKTKRYKYLFHNKLFSMNKFIYTKELIRKFFKKLV